MQHTKECSRCSFWLLLEDFPRNRTKPGGREAECRWCKRYREGLQAKPRKDRTLQRTYGITLNQYEEMFRAQGGRCAICREPESRIRNDGGVLALSVDHEHGSGEVRSLLCSACNSALGRIRDSPLLLSRAVTYLLEHGKKTQ